LLPLLGCGVYARGVVAAGVQDHDGAGRKLIQVVDHALEIQAMGSGVIIPISIDGEARALEEGTVVFPARVADDYLCSGLEPLQEVGTNLQGASATKRLRSQNAAGSEQRTAFAQQQTLRARVVGLDAFDGQVAAWSGCLNTRDLCLVNRLKERNTAFVVVIDPYAEVHLARTGVGIILFVKTQNGVARSEFDRFEKRVHICGHMKERRRGWLKGAEECDNKVFPLGVSSMATTAG